jgi:hypothetical protein
VGRKAIYAGPALRFERRPYRRAIGNCSSYAIDHDHWQPGGLAGDVYWRGSPLERALAAMIRDLCAGCPASSGHLPTSIALGSPCTYVKAYEQALSMSYLTTLSLSREPRERAARRSRRRGYRSARQQSSSASSPCRSMATARATCLAPRAWVWTLTVRWWMGGRCHDVKNLFIVDGSIWVASNGVNPTSTIQALAPYIADSTPHAGFPASAILQV